MKLSTKIIISQILVSIIILVVGLLSIPEIIYRNFSDSVRADVASYSLQITDNISQRLVDINRVTSVLAEDDDLKEKIGNYVLSPNESKLANISLYLSRFYLRENLPSYKVLGIYIVMDESEAEFSTVGLADDVKNYLRKQIITEVKGLESGAMVVRPFEYDNSSDTLFANNFDKLYGYSMRYQCNGKSGVISVISPYSDISSLLTGIKDFAKEYVLLDGTNKVVSSSSENTSIDISYVLDNFQYGETYQSGYINDTQGFSVVTFTTSENWKLICQLKKEEIINRNKEIFKFVIILLVVFEFIVNAITILITKRVLMPLREVSKKMHSVADGKMHVRIAYQSQDEIGEVVKSFNIMTTKLENNIQKLLEKEKTEQKLRYGILISKVDPHFIYNTMNTITYLAEKGKSEDVVIVNKAMIEIMKDRLRIELTDVFDSIQQEIKVLKQYFLIQQYRFESTFKYEMSVENNLEDKLIAKSILQPIAENALLHGILTNRDEDGEMLGGCISLSIKKIEIDGKNMISIQMKDNGSGMNKERLEELRYTVTKDLDSNSVQKGMPGRERGRHIGLRNIQDRLQLLYEGEAQMKIESELGVGTVVTICLPIMTETKKF